MISYILMGCGLAALVFFLILRDKRGSVAATSAKTLVSLLFIATAVAAVIHNIKGHGLSDEARLLSMALFVLGLVCGLVGDIFLDFKIYFRTLDGKFGGLTGDTDLTMYVGMAAFGIGHVCYIAASYVLQPELFAGLCISMGIGAVLIALIMVVGIKVMKMNFGKFLPACIGYGFLLATFVAFSVIRLMSGAGTGKTVLLIGAVLFILSDLILSMTYFSKAEDYKKTGPLNPESRLMIIANHFTYYAAQYLIALSILFL